MRVCLLNPDNIRERKRPQLVTFPDTSTERAELEHIAEAAEAGKPLAVADGNEVHGVALMEAILKSAKSRETVSLASPRTTRSGAKTKRNRR